MRQLFLYSNNTKSNDYNGNKNNCNGYHSAIHSNDMNNSNNDKDIIQYYYFTDKSHKENRLLMLTLKCFLFRITITENLLG